MTFDFAPDWMTSLLNGTSFTVADPVGSASPGAMAVPSYPDCAEVAALVSELFAEGTLSPDQLHSLAGLPELRPHLNTSLAAWPLSRRSRAILP
ncbi:hypothetical protein [Magnetospirillum sp. SS-4]|uniref:hypothetical protein n=1 Tax=Magnetospirillum sp. SS-4 TaxID=2681465 RepID=UPI00138133BA|nr:hypothetical protein [Magnetospirillum sp. SS-4]CAA7626055.1 conserved hypothetical protein [Magnetospirillum sp. SS-4]